MVNDIFAYILKYITSLELTFNWVDFLQIAFLAAVLLFLYRKFIRNTSSEKFVKGLLILVCVWVISEILLRIDLKIIGMFLKAIVTLVSLSLIVIFQPELRRFLGFLGQVDFVSKLFNSNNNSKEQKIDVVKELIESVKFLSKSHTGALIVFQSDLSNTYTDVGTILNADTVLSNSFHATAFSMIFEKDFFVVNRKENINARMKDLLESVGLSRRLVTDSDSMDYISDSEWYNVKLLLADIIEKSKRFLDSVIN